MTLLIIPSICFAASAPPPQPNVSNIFLSDAFLPFQTLLGLKKKIAAKSPQNEW